MPINSGEGNIMARDDLPKGLMHAVFARKRQGYAFRDSDQTVWPWKSGGPKGDRTLDLRIANAALSQLSYRPEGRHYTGAPPRPKVRRGLGALVSGLAPINPPKQSAAGDDEGNGQPLAHGEA